MTRCNQHSPRIAIVGGGLAGIAAAAALSRSGLNTILIERRKLLGGRATSFEDVQTGQLLDNCQHVLLGCCTNLLHLYRWLGVENRIEFFDRILFADETGRRGTLSSSVLPSPVHLAPALLRFPLLSFAAKMEIAQAMAGMKLLDSDRESPSQTFSQWLIDRGQSSQTMARFWNVIITSALNEDISQVSARYGIKVFRQSFLMHRRGYVMGVPNCSLSELYHASPASQTLANTRVTQIRPLSPSARFSSSPISRQPAAAAQRDGGGFTLELSAGHTIYCDILIVATAVDSARKLLAELIDLTPLDKLIYRPIIGLHLFFDQPVMHEPHLALIGTELQWLFRKSQDGRHIHGVISAADQQAGQTNETLLERLLVEVRHLLPAARHAKLLATRIVKEKRATFSPAVGIDQLRPDNATSHPGLFLAGDYTQTDWPATMEGAVRSGYRAAEKVMQFIGRSERFVQPELE